MKYLITLLLLTFTSVADAYPLFGDRVTIYNNGPAASGYYGGSYGVRYGRSYSYGPSYRTYRTYRSAPVVMTYVNPPQVGYTVPAPVAAPADPAPPVQEQPVVQYQYAAPAYSVRSYASPSYFAADDDGWTVTKMKHKERHRHGRSKIKHSETSR